MVNLKVLFTDQYNDLMLKNSTPPQKKEMPGFHHNTFFIHSKTDVFVCLQLATHLQKGKGNTMTLKLLTVKLILVKTPGCGKEKENRESKIVGRWPFEPKPSMCLKCNMIHGLILLLVWLTLHPFYNHLIILPVICIISILNYLKKKKCSSTSLRYVSFKRYVTCISLFFL